MKTLETPPFRKLRGYAFDPSLSQDSATADMNHIIYKVNWEHLQAGPVGEYLEVVDYDPTVDKFYEPVDLNNDFVLAQDGLDPSESNPMFHQQMVYAVAMTTIRNFEHALGRKVLWSPRMLADSKIYEEYVAKLRIYPHAMRSANAYYSPQKKALLFGYFSSTPVNVALQMPGSLVFTCLSHDIIAHETTHAILDGMHRHYIQPSNPDVLAFHEAFADIVALFQHFSFPEVLKHQIAQTRGNLEAQNQLGKLAQQFGTGIGCYGSLRDAIGKVDEYGVWQPEVPDPEAYRTVLEPHARGSILVSAIFEAFINIYKKRAADLLRIASNGTGILPQGELHPDLVNRLAGEAAKAAKHVLFMCIRALDYCPPVDINFGDYLRAIITADLDLVADDDRDYRLMFIEAFRRRGIYPQGIKTLGVESLRHTLRPKADDRTHQLLAIITEHLRKFREKMVYLNDRKAIYDTAKRSMGGGSGNLHSRIYQKFEESRDFENLTGLILGEGWKQLGIRDASQRGPSFQITGLRVVSRVSPEGDHVNQILFSIIQRSGVIVDNGDFAGHFVPPNDDSCPANGFILHGGCTLIFNLDTLELRYAISRPLFDRKNISPDRKIDVSRVLLQHQFQDASGAMGLDLAFNEPFAFLHQ